MAMNPAALRGPNLKAVRLGGMVIVNQDAFTPSISRRPDMKHNPIEENPFPAIAGQGPIRSPQRPKPSRIPASLQADRPLQEFFTSGCFAGLYDRPLEQTSIHRRKFTKSRGSPKANSQVSRPVMITARMPNCSRFNMSVEKANLPPGRYRKITGNEAVALGLVTAARLAGNCCSAATRSRRRRTSCTIWRN